MTVGQTRDEGVSFIVPVYNKKDWLPAVLAALAAQRGSFAREYIFVDDGSTDGSMEIVEAVTASWPAVKLLRQANTGSAAATNRGIALASMPFIKFCDADDLLAHDATRVLLDALCDTSACLVWGERILYHPGQAVDLGLPLVPDCVTVVNDPLPLALRNSLFNPTQFLVRTDAVRRSGGCDERVVHSQEYSLTLRLARLAPFLHLDVPVAWIPVDVPGRLSGRTGDPGRQLQRVTRAVAFFLRDNPDVPVSLVREACRRAAGRAWKYQKRHRDQKILLSPWFWNLVCAFMPGLKGPDFIEYCARAFDTGPGE